MIGVGEETRLFCIYTPRGFSYSRGGPARLRVGDGRMTFPIRLVEEGLETRWAVTQGLLFGGWIRWAFLTWADGKIGLKGLLAVGSDGLF
jgi:hypothetical protein